jgi:peptidoglycan/xylan/chitin deacetylase (PgdA/CDA1 family)
MEVLEKYKVRATFFLVGKDIDGHTSLVKQIHGSGHQLGIHCYRHTPFPLEKPSTLRAQLEWTRNSIAELCGVTPERLQDLRPPYGVFNAKTLTHLSEWGYRLVLWSSIPPHWMQPVKWSIRQVMDSIIPGAIIVLHDGHGHGTRVAEILESVIPQVKSLGFDFVTVEEMQHQREQLTAQARSGS